jgi:hypothetical protein
MTVVCTSYLLFAPRPEGFGLGIGTALGCALVVAAVLTVLFFRYISLFLSGKKVPELDY